MSKSRKARSGPVFQFRPHPWPGLEVGPESPEVLNAFIEITPFDLMKYEVDNVIGGLQMIDREAPVAGPCFQFLDLTAAQIVDASELGFTPAHDSRPSHPGVRSGSRAVVTVSYLLLRLLLRGFALLRPLA